MDQPAGLLERMTAALNTYNSCKVFKQNAHDQKWIAKNWDTVEFITNLEKMERENGTELN